MAPLSKVALAAAACSLVAASPYKRDGVDNTQPAGTNPINGFKVDFLGNQVSDNSCNHRDLGFAGHIAGEWFAIYGDNLWCSQGVTNPDQDPTGFHGQVRDSVSSLGNNPLVVHDLNLNGDTPVGHPNQFVPFNADWGETQSTGFGGTSLVEVDPSNAVGALYYLVAKNQNDGGLIGAGIAQVQVLLGNAAVSKRYGDRGYWWDANTTPHYGDIAAYQDENSDYIYIIGNPPNSQSGLSGSYAYQARVNASAAFDLSQYNYWWGRQQGWKTDVLTEFTPETAVMWGAGQGQIVYSNYFKTYLFVHMGGNSLQIRAAPSPEGPWTADKQLYTDTPTEDGGYIYAGIAYPYLDTTGKTLTVAWTNSNHIRVAKITFD